jgi:hypothetical protein
MWVAPQRLLRGLLCEAVTLLGDAAHSDTRTFFDKLERFL